ncbi:MAG: DUF4071 domain-containing protein [Gammaproteobacteria bacterium]|nr:DUF4071 domain-containing protein [Gammaproteobacteria bacterium]
MTLDSHNNDEARGSSAADYQARVRSLVSAGKPVVAFELTREAREQYPDDAQLQYLQGLALARGGNASQSEKLIKALLKRSDLSPKVRVDTLSLSARIHKDRYLRAGDPADRQGAARRSAELYRMAYTISKNPFPGVNAATMQLLAGGDRDVVGKLAGEVHESATRFYNENQQDYWAAATLGEACLLLEACGDVAEHSEAARWYRSAVNLAADNRGDVASMRRQVEMLRNEIEVPQSLIDELSVGTIAVYSGHMIDHPGDDGSAARPVRFPPGAQLEKLVAGQIDALIDELDIREAFGSAACGADLLFAERLLARGHRAQIVLPFELEDFFRSSVDFGLSADYWQSWRARCERVLEHANTEVHFATHERNPGGDLMFAFVNQICQGLALQRAKVLNTTPWATVIAEASIQQAVGGASDFLSHWQQKGEPFASRTRIIDIAALREENHGAGGGKSSEDNSARLPVQLTTRDPTSMFGTDEMMLRSMLFADVSGFSALREDQAKIFFIHFLDKVAQLVSETSDTPVFQNTWGDGLFFVFRDPTACARFALSLVETANTTDFESLGLPADLAIRAGIHTGPVFVLPDPIIGKNNVFGAHVNRAARIEPVTIPGCVYASEQMAAVLSDLQCEDLILEYIGLADLAKAYDRCPLYQVAAP